MVAYSFKASFEAPIIGRTKRQTIRLPRKRHARPGEILQLYVGMRTRSCRLIGKSLCTEISEVRLDFEANVVSLGDAIELAEPEELDAFAIDDGFTVPERLRGTVSPWTYMRRWWSVTHPDQNVFRGVLIGWGELL